MREITMSKFIIIWVMFLVLFTDRFYLNLFSSHLEILPLINLTFTFLLVLITRGKVLGFIRSKTFLIGILPFLFFNILFPLLGVIIYNYPLTSTYLLINPLVWLSLIILGYFISHYKISQKWMENYLVIYILIQVFFALTQFLYWKGILHLGIMDPIIKWDLKIQDSDKVIYGRSIGLFSNPNILGFWSVTTFWLAFFLLKGIKRKIGLVLVIVVLALSQSRGSIVTLLATLSIYYFYITIKGRQLNRALKGSMYLIISLAIGYLLIINIEALEPFLYRLISAFGIFTNGISSDSNLSGRFEAWKLVINVFFSYPFGTLGSPELIIGSFIDNEWVRLLIQGSFVFIIAFLMLFWNIYKLGGIGGNLGTLLRLLLLCILLNGITQIPLSYSAVYMFWFFIGILLRKRAQMNTY
jgi:hypothetical protein